jgi:DNA-binding response OmpR family regulator
MRAKTAASVLLFNNSNLRSDSRINDPKLYSALKTAGHSFTVATDLKQFEASLASTMYDLVIVDESDMAGLTQAVQAAPSKPLVLPILTGKKASEGDYIKYIDQAIAAKHK